jgi:hypothetical protein
MQFSYNIFFFKKDDYLNNRHLLEFSRNLNKINKKKTLNLSILSFKIKILLRIIKIF